MNQCQGVRSQVLECVSRKVFMLRARERWTLLKCSQFKINLKDVTEAYGHHKHNAEEHLFLDGTLPLLPVCLLWSLATHWWGIRKSLRNTNSRMAQSQPTPDCICVFIHSLVGVKKKQTFIYNFFALVIDGIYISKSDSLCRYFCH